MLKPAPRMTSVNKLVRIAREGISGRLWYSQAAAEIDYVSWLEGWDRDTFAGVLATTSPRCSVLRNIRMSLHFMKFRDLTVVPMKGIRKSVREFLIGNGIAGPKTSAFYHNLSGFTNYVTLDVWMAYALGIDQVEFKAIECRRKATDRVIRVGERLGIAPAEAQAAIWTGFRARAGYKPSAFSVVSEYYAARNNGWVIEGCTIGSDYDKI